MIPGLRRAEFLRFGSVHRNTFINSPLIIEKDLSLKIKRDVYLAGQMTGVEGYIESTAIGLIAGIHAARRMAGVEELVEVPATTAHGSLIRHITSCSKVFQPSNINFGLFPSPACENSGIRDKKVKKKMVVERAIHDWEGYIKRIGR
jgi:methylenetetrahydrofolate--tRNA-(uracil-5-)-methyltransferase